MAVSIGVFLAGFNTSILEEKYKYELDVASFYAEAYLAYNAVLEKDSNSNPAGIIAMVL